MEVAYYPKKITNKKTTLIMGGFKFIHNGHKRLIEVAKTFKNPISMMLIVRKEDLISLDIRLVQLAKLGVSYVHVIKFDSKFQGTTGKDFLKTIKEISNAKNIVAGEDFTFGKNRTMSVKDIKDITIVKLAKINNKKVSTAFIKELITLGEVDVIKEMSPFPYTIQLNANAKKEITAGLPKDLHAGIYAIFAIVNSVKYYGYIYLNMKGGAKIFVPDLLVKNNSFKPVVRLIKMTRKIYVSKQDELLKDDEEKVILYLNKYI